MRRFTEITGDETGKSYQTDARHNHISILHCDLVFRIQLEVVKESENISCNDSAKRSARTAIREHYTALIASYRK